ncbi:2-oxo-4-hydroxy-4-carboxy-5-ureidoimidazoline decarboxylase [Kibdelosporangium phytohabitans]|uniref:2-oxo-4-hydroxy-4-carboxy-5-ureidoimidazoline decarboxylase n=1 Tax=Kibdelosporangium phytohabitans TaxID=860235 RepID=UPI000AAA7EC0|nr:2-oxo-4-hydroxy-4-carboxy-5-ureidoimidazoline decarboxylase [Kibdelosporangium phytohabitans]MBE1469977.1 2-oxo-4-hydroxy-4-carboxy-5-ureidoimidazoline decarboxylase [Kibdelosporangium phytohabitans]
MLPRLSIEQLLACCASRRWALRMDAAAPYPDVAELLATADAELAALGWRDVTEALAAHPRIGQRPTGTGQEAEWSRHEQAAAVGSDAELAAANEAYERKFGRVFLISAAGRAADEVLAESRRRLANNEVAERDEVRRELAAIVRGRLARCAG